RFSTFLEHVKPSQGGQRVTKFNALSALGRLHMLQECGEPANHPAFLQAFSHLEESFQIHTGLFGALSPGIQSDLVHGELLLQRDKHLPVKVAQFYSSHRDHAGEFWRFIAGLDCLAADVTHAKGKDSLGRHELVLHATGVAHQHFRMLCH
ncbi:MAG: hypothetical protein EOP84_33560, partial [Verrucomicrobiaceae bacterium]